MGFFNSVINQIGRDVGRSISNKVLKDAHARPIRVITSDTVITEKKKQLLEYQKQILKIDLTQTPKTIIRKLGALLVEFDTTVTSYLDDNHIDLQEEIELVKMFFEILQVFDKIEKQFIINSVQTTELFDIYREHFENPILNCIDHLIWQEEDESIKTMYVQLHTEIKNILR